MADLVGLGLKTEADRQLMESGAVIRCIDLSRDWYCVSNLKLKNSNSKEMAQRRPGISQFQNLM